jgi:hypothetical protein
MDNLEQEILEKANALISKEENVLEGEININPEKSLTEQAVDVVGLLATKNAITDTNLVSDITDTKKKELKEDAEAHLKKQQAENRNADIKLQEANYGVYSGVASYAGIKKPLPAKFQSFMFFCLLFIQAPVLLIGGGFTSVVSILLDCIRTIVDKIAGLAKVTRILVASLFGIGLFVLIIYIILVMLKKYGIIGG